jgi:hypothetical protein
MTRLSRFAVLFFIAFSGVSVFAQAQIGWRPVTQAELDMKTPQVEADADAEAIFWEVSLDDKEKKKLFYNHYVRVKIFTERGREKFSKVDIPFTKGKIVEDVAARVIKPDGTIVELKPSDIFEREIIRSGKIRVLAKSFAIPAIEPGVIVEYQYKETFKNESVSGDRLILQRNIPMQRTTYFIRPFKGNNLRFDFRNTAQIPFHKNEEGFYVGTLMNVPAIKEEPNMPPEDEVIKWARLSYDSVGYNWDIPGYDWSVFYRQAIVPKKEIRQKAEELTRNVATEEEKLEKLYNFVRTEIKNVTFDNSMTAEQKEKFETKNLADVLKKRMGREAELNYLFAGLAKALQFQTAMIMSFNRNESFFTPERGGFDAGIHLAGIAVILRNGKTKYINAGNPYLPFGKLGWFEEGSFAMLVDDAGHQWKRLPITNYLESSARRTGKFKLLEDGTLEGTITLEYDGHQAINRRMNEYKNSPAKREENIREEIKNRISTAEISEVSITNFDDATKLLTYSMKIRVPNYASKTGKRLFLQPGFFEYGAKPLFSSATRTYPIYFEYPWSEEDNIEIELPNGYLTDNAASPGDVLESKNIASLKTSIGIVKGTNTLKYNRRFYFGNGVLFFKAETYSALKTLWDKIQAADSHTISLKQSAE